MARTTNKIKQTAAVRKTDKSARSQVDRYIAQAPEFAQPILERIRKAFHMGCPEVEEAIKWGVPHFMYQGMLGGMAAFKQHVGFGFWKSKLMSDPAGLFAGDPKASMCTARITSVRDLPSMAVMVEYVREAARLNEEGVKAPKTTKNVSSPVTLPAELVAAFKKPAHKKAKTTFEGFSPSHRREYVEWIEEAKRAETRQQRVATTLDWLGEGKTRNWKYTSKGKP